MPNQDCGAFGEWSESLQRCVPAGDEVRVIENIKRLHRENGTGSIQNNVANFGSTLTPFNSLVTPDQSDWRQSNIQDSPGKISPLILLIVIAGGYFLMRA